MPNLRGWREALVANEAIAKFVRWIRLEAARFPRADEKRQLSIAFGARYISNDD
jgi:hypothetical protein